MASSLHPPRTAVLSLATQLPTYAAFLLSGASSLVFQNIWSRDLHHVFGATSEAISTIVTMFMAGLGLGAFVAGRYADRIKHPIITYAFAEIGVGVWALLVPFLLDVEGWLAGYNALLRNSNLADSAAALSLGRFVAVLPVLLVPTTLMGTTLPLLSRHFVQASDRAGGAAAKVGTLYAVNTFGAVAGIFLAGFVLMPTIGVFATNLVGVSLNFLLGFGILALRRPLLAGTWSPGQKLEWWPTRPSPGEEGSGPPPGDESTEASPDEPPSAPAGSDLPPDDQPAPSDDPAASEALDDAGPTRRSKRKRGNKSKGRPKRIGGASPTASPEEEEPPPRRQVAWARAAQNARRALGAGLTLVGVALLLELPAVLFTSVTAWCLVTLTGVGGLVLLVVADIKLKRASSRRASSVPFFAAAALLAVPAILLGWLTLWGPAAALALSGVVTGVRRRRGPAAEPLDAAPPPESVRPEPDDTLPVPRIARLAAFITFALSGAAALCYEVVWTRALAMTIGSSIYSFALILATFLIGIAGGSALAASMLRRSVGRLSTAALASLALLGLACVPWGVAEGFDFYLLLWAGLGLFVALIWLVATSVTSGSFVKIQVERPAMLMLALPVLVAASGFAHADLGDQVLTWMCLGVVSCITAYLTVLIGFRRSPVLLIASIQFLIAMSTFVNYLALDEVPYAFARLVTSLDDLPSQVGLVQFFMFFTAGLCTLPAAIGMGAMFPLTVRVWSHGGDDIGRDVGVVYAGNTLGSIVGAWLPGFVLMPWIGMEAVLVSGIVLNLALALVMVVVSASEPDTVAPSELGAGPFRESKPRAPEPQVPVWHAVTVYVLAPLIPALAAILIISMLSDSFGMGTFDIRWSRGQMTLGVFRVSLAADVLNPDSWGEPDILFYADGRSTTVSVEKWGRHLAMKNNGKVDASNGDDMPTQIMVAGFPLLMHPEGPDDLDVAVIGFGSGVSVGAALQFPVRSVDVVELEQNIPLASQFFADVNHLEYPGCDDADDSTPCEFPYARADRLTVINDDGRNYLAATDKPYDVIMSEPSNPWITGVSDLFTTDHFRITKQKLRPGGIYCQWVQLYEMSPENIKTIYRTFASQFEHVVVFSAEDLSSDTIMLGSDSPLPLDLERVSPSFLDPRVAAELERAYIHSPFDLFARVILASREEVLAYTQIEERLRGGVWQRFPESSNGGECDPSNCRRLPAPLNTDDNALIEFAAPRDLIGFQAYEGYLANIYSPEWPYGRLMDQVQGFGTDAEAARAYAELGMSLIAHGRKAEAGEFIQRSFEFSRTRETLVAAEVLRLLLSDDHEPAVSIEPPIPGAEMDDRAARQLLEGFEAVRVSVDLQAYGSALAEMEQIPSPLRLHSGPSMRMLYAYLLYKAASGSPGRYQAAIEQLEELVRSEELYVRRHPELYYFLARAHDAEFHFDKALRNMRLYVEARLVPRDDSHELPEPAIEEAPTTDEPGESPKDTHQDRT